MSKEIQQENAVIKAAKRNARKLQMIMEKAGATVAYCHCLEVIAMENGYKNWRAFRALSEDIAIRSVIDLSE